MKLSYLDGVRYVQLEMFDHELEGRKGCVMGMVKPLNSNSTPMVDVYFDDLGKRTVPIHCLEKIKN